MLPVKGGKHFQEMSIAKNPVCQKEPATVLSQRRSVQLTAQTCRPYRAVLTLYRFSQYIPPFQLIISVQAFRLLQDRFRVERTISKRLDLLVSEMQR